MGLGFNLTWRGDLLTDIFVCVSLSRSLHVPFSLSLCMSILSKQGGCEDRHTKKKEFPKKGKPTRSVVSLGGAVFGKRKETQSYILFVFVLFFQGSSSCSSAVNGFYVAGIFKLYIKEFLFFFK